MEVALASLDTAVLRYDGQGRLIVPDSSEPTEEAREGEGGTTEVSDSTKGVAAPAGVLPQVRLIATRYQDDPALETVDLSPAEWAAFFQVSRSP